MNACMINKRKNKKTFELGLMVSKIPLENSCISNLHVQEDYFGEAFLESGKVFKIDLVIPDNFTV